MEAPHPYNLAMKDLKALLSKKLPDFSFFAFFAFAMFN
jgi:hypothetical protein